MQKESHQMLKGRIQLTHHANILSYSEVSSRRPASGRAASSASGQARSRARQQEKRLQERDGDERARSSRASHRGNSSESIKHRLRKAKADRAFDKRYASAPASSEGGPRAALYEGRMGHTHKKSSRMQNEASRKRTSRSAKVRSTFVFGKLRIVGAILVVAVLALGFLYPAAKDSYVAMRAQAQLQAEYDALVQRNEAIQANVDRLSTDEGVEDKAREDFGWVKSGENSVNVYGLEEDEEALSTLNADVTAGSVPAPETWYSSFLDPLFGVNPDTVAKDQ